MQPHRRNGKQPLAHELSFFPILLVASGVSKEATGDDGMVPSALLPSVDSISHAYMSLES